MATHLPFGLREDHQEKLILEGHFAKANPQWKEIKDGQEVLCIFNGPHAYISSSWYQQEDVPTWNYQAVHIRGTYKRQSPSEVLAALQRLVDKYEKDSEQPVSLQKLSQKTLNQVNGIVGFQIESLHVDAAYKLSQGRDTDHQRIKVELNKRGGMSSAIASAMEE